jgi:hypothetical protein
MDISTSVIQVVEVAPNLPGFKYGYIRFLMKGNGLIQDLALSSQYTIETNFDGSCVSTLLDGEWNIATFSTVDTKGEIIITGNEE